MSNATINIENLNRSGFDIDMETETVRILTKPSGAVVDVSSITKKLEENSRRLKDQVGKNSRSLMEQIKKEFQKITREL